MPVLPTQRRLVHSRHLDHGDSVESSLQVTPSDSALVWGALAFTLRVTRFFGTAPLSFVRVRDGCWKVQVSPLMRIYSYIFIVVLNLLVFSGIAMYDIGSFIRDFGWLGTLDICLVIIISSYGILSAPFMMKQFLISMNHINKVSSTLKCEHIMRKPENIRCWIIVLFTFGVISMFAGDIASFVNSMSMRKMSTIQFNLYLFWYVQLFILVLLELQYILTAILPYTALQGVNKELTAFTIAIEWKNSASHSKDIRRLSLAYSAICDMVRQVDKSNGLLLLLLLVSCLIHMVISPFYVITALLNQKLEFVMYVVWCVYHAIKMVMIVEPGRRMQQEIHKTQTLVSQLMNRASSPKDPIAEALHILHKQIILNPVVFSPLGICILSRPLIASVLGAVTTYLVILVQFKNFNP